jgi:uncharacterized protein with HEPN domain
LRHVLDSIDRIETYAAPGQAAFDADRMRQDAIARNLEIIGEAVARVPDEVRAMAPDFSWREPVGMRNWLIHGYDVVDPEIVWSTITDGLPKLRLVVGRLLEPGTPPAG